MGFSKPLCPKMFVPLLMTIFISSVIAQSGHPEFDPTMEKVVLVEGTSASVECVAKGEPPLTLNWFNQRDEQIGSNANQEVFTRPSQDGLSLNFGSVKPCHDGLYSCSATNKHGTATKYYDIIIERISGNRTTNETTETLPAAVMNITDNSVEFYVQTIGDPDHFYIRYQEKLDKEEKWIKIKRGEKAIVKDLVPAGHYEFRFQIEDPSEYNSTTAPYYVTLLPAVPDVIFRNIRDGLVDVEWFRSVDDFFRGTIEEYELSYNIIRQREGRYWESSDCGVTIKIPNLTCSPARYTIAGLERGIYYEVRLRVKTSVGFGKPFASKIYTL